MSEEDYESTAFIRNGGNVPSRDSLTCPEGNPYITVTLHYCYLTTYTRCVNSETTSVEGSVIIGSNNYQYEVRIEDVFRRHHCERHRLETGASAIRKCVVKYLQLAD